MMQEQQAPKEQRARQFAIEAHGDQKYGVLPYVAHLDEVVDIVLPYKDRYGEDLVVVAYLHDVLEDTETDPERIERDFSRFVRCQVEAITDPEAPNRKERKRLLNARLAGLVCQHLDGQDFFDVALLVKAADRLANMRHSQKINPGLLRMYIQEYPVFKVSAFTSAWLPIWEAMGAIFKSETSEAP